MMYTPQQQQQIFQRFNNSQDKNNYDVDDDQPEITISNVQDLSIALEKAMNNIVQLQNNLSFMIKYNEQIKEQQSIQSKKHAKTVQNLQKALLKRDQQIQKYKHKYEEYETLIEDTKEALSTCQQNIVELQEKLEQKDRIIFELQKTKQALEDENLANKYNEVSLQSNQSCFIQIQEMERRMEELEYQKKRLSATVEKQTKRAVQLQKENGAFRSWLGEIVGVKKVISGCQTVIMAEISKKLRGQI